MSNGSTILDTFSQNIYMQGMEPALDQLTLAKRQFYEKKVTWRADEIQLLYVLKGSGSLWINGIKRSLSPGMLGQLFPYHVCSVESCKGEVVECYLLRFPLSILMYLDVKKRFIHTDYSFVESGEVILPLAQKDLHRAQQSFAEIQRELEEKNPYYLHIVLGNLFCLIGLFNRQAQRQYAQQGPALRSTAWEALQYIHMHFNKTDMDSAHVAALLGTTPQKLGYMLRTLTGQSFMQNLHEVRIRNACAMMVFEEISVSFISRYVGYTSIATFYRVFKKLKGVAPEQYRNGMLGHAIPSKHRDTAWNLLVYVLEHYAEDINPAETARSFFMSEETLNQTCQVNFDMNFRELIERVRITFASSLLAASTIPVYDIAMAVGFNSTRTFSRCFKEQTGTTPRAYRQCLTQHSASN